MAAIRLAALKRPAGQRFRAKCIGTRLQGMEIAMIETLKERVNDDPALVRRGRFLTTTFLLEVGATPWLVAIYEGRILSVTRGPFVMPSSSFALRAPEEEWEKFW